jgi:carbonic anhydrase
VTNKDKLFKAEIWAGEDEKSYEATEFNFHAPSEHTFNGW